MKCNNFYKQIPCLLFILWTHVRHTFVFACTITGETCQHYGKLCNSYSEQTTITDLQCTCKESPSHLSSFDTWISNNSITCCSTESLNNIMFSTFQSFGHQESKQCQESILSLLLSPCQSDFQDMYNPMYLSYNGSVSFQVCKLTCQQLYKECAPNYTDEISFCLALWGYDESVFCRDRFLCSMDIDLEIIYDEYDQECFHNNSWLTHTPTILDEYHNETMYHRHHCQSFQDCEESEFCYLMNNETMGECQECNDDCIQSNCTKCGLHPSMIEECQTKCIPNYDASVMAAVFLVFLFVFLCSCCFCLCCCYCCASLRHPNPAIVHQPSNFQTLGPKPKKARMTTRSSILVANERLNHDDKYRNNDDENNNMENGFNDEENNAAGSLLSYIQSSDDIGINDIIQGWMEKHPKEMIGSLTPNDVAVIVESMPTLEEQKQAALQIAKSMGNENVLTCQHIAATIKKCLYTSTDIAMDMIPYISDPQNKSLVIQEILLSFQKEEVYNCFLRHHPNHSSKIQYA